MAKGSWGGGMQGIWGLSGAARALCCVAGVAEALHHTTGASQGDCNFVLHCWSFLGGLEPLEAVAASHCTVVQGFLQPQS